MIVILILQKNESKGWNLEDQCNVEKKFVMNDLKYIFWFNKH